MTAAAWHAGRTAHWTASRDIASNAALLLSRLRLATFAGAAILLWWGARTPALGAARTIGLTAGAASLAAFGLLVVRHARVLHKIERAEAALQLNREAIARLARDWNALPDVPSPDVDLDAHPYARDLDLVGHGSLAKWLGRPATIEGVRCLWSWLLAPAQPAVILERQAAVEELASLGEWRETLAIEGRLTNATPAELARFLEWAEDTRPAVPRFLQTVIVIVPAATLGLLAAFAAGVTDGAWFLIPMLIAIVLSFAFAHPMNTTFDRATLGERALSRYAAMLALSCRAWTAPALERLRQELCAGGDAPARITALARLGGWSELRTGAALLHFPIQALTMWDFHVLFALERWRSRSGAHVRGWIDALGRVDALAVLARVRADYPEWTTPRVDADAAALQASGLGHPLIADDRRVHNDVTVGPRGTLVLITGSNMSGKSTLLRAIGLNAVLAQAGSPVCATAFTMPAADLHTSIRVQDSLELGLSYFMAALARLKGIVDAAERGAGPGRTILYLLDEVLQGTNSIERGVAVRAVVRHLLQAGAIGVMTTHDLALASEEPIASAARLAHFTEQVHPDGSMTFDYRLRPGLATSTNALRLMQLIGIAPE